MACPELVAFRAAVESLDQRVLNDPRLGRARFWRDMFPMGTFIKNQGVTRSTFTIKTSEPRDDQSLWNDITLSNGLPSPSCATTYEDIGVGFFERTYGPRRRDFRGPLICKRNLTYMHSPEEFLNGYVMQIGGFLSRVWEFALRADYIRIGNVYVDGVKYAGPNALATAPRAYQGLSQSLLNIMAQGQINVGAGTVTGNYVNLGDAGPIFPLELDMMDSEGILRANPLIREDSRLASEGLDGKGDFSLWKAIGAKRVIGNYRHISTMISPRLNYNGGYVGVSPFKDITQMGTDNETLTQAYKDAGFGVAIHLDPEAFQPEAVTPSNWKFPDSRNYNGELDFIVGGERVCDPPIYDPHHENGRHFGAIEYAPKPKQVHLAALTIYKRCPQSNSTIYCS